MRLSVAISGRNSQRLDDQIIFHSLRRELRQIVSLQVERLRSRLMGRKLDLNISDGATDWLANAGYDPVYGARPLKRHPTQAGNPDRQSDPGGSVWGWRHRECGCGTGARQRYAGRAGAALTPRAAAAAKQKTNPAELHSKRHWPGFWPPPSSNSCDHRHDPATGWPSPRPTGLCFHPHVVHHPQIQSTLRMQRLPLLHQRIVSIHKERVIKLLAQLLLQRPEAGERPRNRDPTHWRQTRS